MGCEQSGHVLVLESLLLGSAVDHVRSMQLEQLIVSRLISGLVRCRRKGVRCLEDV